MQVKCLGEPTDTYFTTYNLVTEMAVIDPSGLEVPNGVRFIDQNFNIDFYGGVSA